MKKSDLEAVIRGIAPVIREYVTKALEARPGVEYAGVFEQGKAYGRGNLCTRNGSLWLALNDTTDAPGRSPHWKLIVKSGDAR